MKLLTCFALWCLCAVALQAQVDLLEYRPKVIEIGYRGFSNYQSTSMNANGENEFISDQLLTVRLGIPIVLREKSLFGVQLKYYRQSYNTAFIPQSDENIYRYLNQERLINTGLNFLYQRNLSDTKKLVLLGVTELASDTRYLNRYSGRYYVAGSYNTKKREDLELGYGLVVNYALGVLNIYPTFTYNRALSAKAMIEATLPSFISLRYHVSDKSYFIAKAMYDNWRYNVTDAIDQQQSQLTLQRADFLFNVTYEQEVYDWLWLATEVSYVNNVAYIVSLPGERLNNPLQEYKLKDAAYLKFSVFIVPPEKLWKKVK
ncbi:DUF6268 family outer membrane beta-barrel protein [Roseivirga sp.]|uniref:DUF6268 family outer membrane beta-barrel protein n=1 Tax=Roseivirga sp. TaxID=1964215 RepID=UPI003B524BEC